MLRLGSIEFINSLPVDLGLQNGAVPHPAQVVQGEPSRLNEMMQKGQLDLGPVSALWYGRHQKEFLILPGLSVSSRSTVQSVLFFSRFRLKDLSNEKILASAAGCTTPALFRILCRLRYGIQVRLEEFHGAFQGIPKGAAGVLMIGDEALKASQSVPEDIRVTDLAQEWQAWTGLPLVFALWVVRRPAFEKVPHLVYAMHEALLESKKWGLEHLDEVMNEAQRRIHLSRRTLRRYFRGLSYEFGEDLRRGMKLYLDYAAQCGIIEPVGEWEEIEEGDPCLSRRF